MRADDEDLRGDTDPRDDRVDELFSSLREHSEPEIDSEAAWRRLRAALPERQPSLGWGRPAWGLPLAAAAVLFVTVALVLQSAWWTGTEEAGPGDGIVAEAPAGSDLADDTLAAADTSDPAEPAADEPTPTGPAADSDFVLLAGDDQRDPSEPTPGASDADAAPILPPAGYTLEVRLLRAVGEGQAPALGAGGSDPLADLRTLLNSVTPDRAYEIAGSWSGELAGGSFDATLDDLRHLRFEVDPEDPTRLRAVRLTGGGEQTVADELELSPGAPYLFGVRDASGATGEILLSLRLRRVGAPIDPQPREHQPRDPQPRDPRPRDPGPRR